MSSLFETELKMTPKDKAEKIFYYLNLDFVAAEGAICLLHQHCDDTEYWEEVWEHLIDTHGENWQKIEFQYNRQDYINACTL